MIVSFIRRFTLLQAVVLGCLAASPASAQLSDSTPDELTSNDDVSGNRLETRFRDQVIPVLKRYCFECHAGERLEAEIDFSEFSDLAAVRKRPEVWQNVRGMLRTGQMPPDDSPQPSAEESERLRHWVEEHLKLEAKARSGDPGRVVLRRLSNSEYTHVIGDLTGITLLDPTREFPIDGAAGEGFTNVGDGLVMSPSMIGKYMDAAKEVSSHMVLLPDGITFSDHSTRRDWTDQWLARIQNLYRRYTAEKGATSVNLQGIVFDTNQGGRLPITRYLDLLIQNQEAITSNRGTLRTLAEAEGLSPRYLATLRDKLFPEASTGNFVLDRIAKTVRDSAESSEQANRVSIEVAKWQDALWKFSSVGHLGSEGRPKAWMEPVNPVVMRQDLNLELAGQVDDRELVFQVNVTGFGNGANGQSDYVSLKNMRLSGGPKFSGGPKSIPMSEVNGLAKRIDELRTEMLLATERYLKAAASYESSGATGQQIAEVANSHQVDPQFLLVWLRYLAIDDAQAVPVEGHYVKTEVGGGGYSFVSGWGTGATPSILANASDQEVRIPGIARPKSVVVHPSPTLFTAVGWRSPIDGPVRINAEVADAHPECGNGVEFFLQHRTGNAVANLWHGNIPVAGKQKSSEISVVVRKGDLLSLIIGPRDGQHACDLTQIEMTLTEADGQNREWNLAADVSGDILSANPRDDRYGHPATWHFYKGEMSSIADAPGGAMRVPAGSLVEKWKATSDPGRRMLLANEIRQLVVNDFTGDPNSPDGLSRRQILSFAIPSDHPVLRQSVDQDRRFGTHPLGGTVDPTELVVKVPSVVEFRVPAELARGRHVQLTAELDAESRGHGAAQVQLVSNSPEQSDWQVGSPILVNARSKDQVISALDEVRRLMPPALCYARIVPVDEVVTFALFHREDQLLQDLMLEPAEVTELNRLWDELLFVSQEPTELVVALEQQISFATQDRPDLVIKFKPLKAPVKRRAEAFRLRQLEAEPKHVQAVISLAERAWRRRISRAEQNELRGFYQSLRREELSHEQSVSLLMVRVLTSPDFLYRRERPVEGGSQGPVTDAELASRLSFFLWSSIPDDELTSLAREGRLSGDNVLRQQAGRMLADPKSRRMAELFACQWLHVRNFDKEVEKNERLYPEFAQLKQAMNDETEMFFFDMIQNNRSILEMIRSDHTFLNQDLANHYGIEGVRGERLRRVGSVSRHGRGGVLSMATVLSSQSGASRTSPILRGNWVYETLLGQRLPRPPADVPQLPDEVAEGLTTRQMIERHRSDAACSKCHAEIDPYGFSLEQFDAIGRMRPVPVDTKTKLPDGKEIDGIEGLRDYLLEHRREEFVRQFCRKLLGYALGRAVMLSDEPLLEEMSRCLSENEYQFHAVVFKVVQSRQFREIRGREFLAR